MGVGVFTDMKLQKKLVFLVEETDQNQNGKNTGGVKVRQKTEG